MARILSELKVQLSPEGTSWTLLEPLEYHVGSPDSDEIIEVPTDTRTDFASVPWFARWFVSTWKQTARGAVIHDYLFDERARAVRVHAKAGRRHLQRGAGSHGPQEAMVRMGRPQIVWRMGVERPREEG